MYLVNAAVDLGVEDERDEQLLDFGRVYVQLRRNERDADPRVRPNQLQQHLTVEGVAHSVIVVHSAVSSECVVTVVTEQPEGVCRRIQSRTTCWLAYYSAVWHC